MPIDMDNIVLGCVNTLWDDTTSKRSSGERSDSWEKRKIWNNFTPERRLSDERPIKENRRGRRRSYERNDWEKRRNWEKNEKEEVRKQFQMTKNEMGSPSKKMEIEKSNYITPKKITNQKYECSEFTKRRLSFGSSIIKPIPLSDAQAKTHLRRGIDVTSPELDSSPLLFKFLNQTDDIKNKNADKFYRMTSEDKNKFVNQKTEESRSAFKSLFENSLKEKMIMQKILINGKNKIPGLELSELRKMRKDYSGLRDNARSDLIKYTQGDNTINVEYVRATWKATILLLYEIDYNLAIAEFVF
jgi:hypothetical protein